MIPVRNSASTIEDAVASVLSQGYGSSVEVILAEGASSDDSRTVIEKIADAEPRVRVVDNPSGLTATGLNTAIAVSTGEVIVRCDAHAQLPPAYIATAVRRLAATGAGVVGGVQDATGETVFERAVASAMANPLGSGGAAYRTAGTEGVVETVYLGVFRREVLVEVGLFDESLVRNQDYELNHRIRDAGYDVFFAPELRVRYRPRGNVADLWRQYYSYGRWKRLVLRRSPGSLRLRQLAAPTLLLGLLASLLLAFTPWPWLATVVPLAYAAAIVGATLREALRRRDRAVWLVAPVLATMHLAWGAGFWRSQTGSPAPQIARLDR